MFAEEDDDDGKAAAPPGTPPGGVVGMVGGGSGTPGGSAAAAGAQQPLGADDGTHEGTRGQALSGATAMDEDPAAAMDADGPADGGAAAGGLQSYDQPHASMHNGATEGGERRVQGTPAASGAAEEEVDPHAPGSDYRLDEESGMYYSSQYVCRFQG